MGEKYSKEDHDKCKKVAEVFQELYDILGDTCVRMQVNLDLYI